MSGSRRFCSSRALSSAGASKASPSSCTTAAPRPQAALVPPTDVAHSEPFTFLGGRGHLPNRLLSRVPAARASFTPLPLPSALLLTAPTRAQPGLPGPARPRPHRATQQGQQRGDSSRKPRVRRAPYGSAIGSGEEQVG